jgi:ketosteroid isomerase-like protein
MSLKSIFCLTVRRIFVGLAFCHACACLAADDPKADSNSTTQITPTRTMNQEITNQIKAYEKALNTSDASAALAVYGSDPIFMAQHMEAFVGRAAVQASYEHIFKAIKLNVVFTIHEIVSMGGDLAYARTTSAGQTEILAARKTVKEANNELFIFRKEAGQWKIHRYLFATSNPPAGN